MGADMVAITRVDLVGDREVDDILNCLRSHINGTPVIELSPERDRGLREALALVESSWAVSRG
jgi:signal recognition particle receptor subunit beta